RQTLHTSVGPPMKQSSVPLHPAGSMHARRSGHSHGPMGVCVHGTTFWRPTAPLGHAQVSGVSTQGPPVPFEPPVPVAPVLVDPVVVDPLPAEPVVVDAPDVPPCVLALGFELQPMWQSTSTNQRHA